MRKHIYLLVLIILVSGCATKASSLNKISLGMTKEEVIRSIGYPETTSAQDSIEYLKYRFHDRGDPGVAWGEPVNKEYYVRLINGKVESYGKMGDFDSTKNATDDVNLNINQQK